MTETRKTGLFDRTLRNLRYAWREIAGSPGDFAPDLPEEDRWRAEEQIQACIDARGGEVAARALAAKIGQGYLNLDAVGRERFLVLLATRFETDRGTVADAAREWLEANPDASGVPPTDALRQALEAPRLRLLTRFNGLPQGVKFLVDMRADLLRLGKNEPALRGLDDDMRRLLTAWFDVGFLRLEQITWDSSAALLEKLIAYEAVHAIDDWADMKDRLDVDRRCFAFFHPRMPEEPLIFVEVALLAGMADSIQALLDDAAPAANPSEADAAMFYSISNTQPGLAGISLGDFLIKQVVDRLVSEFSGLRTFATLSPIPGFRRWLDDSMSDGSIQLTAAERKRLLETGIAAGAGEITADYGDIVLLTRLMDRPGWWSEDGPAKALQPPLMRLGSSYLLNAKGNQGRARDRVAHFHLRNGARVERLNWLGDTSARGMRQSAGMMINYLYRRDAIEENHCAYVTNGRIAASSSVRGLAKG